MVRTTFYTEDRDNLEELVVQHFNGATILRGVGSWKGTLEKCALIIVLEMDSYDARKNIQSLADKIKSVNKQQSVLIEQQYVNTRLV